MIKSSSRVICDAGPIIHLDEINCLNLLNDFEEIVLPISVEREIAVHRSSALTDSNLILEDMPKTSTLHIKPSLMHEILRKIKDEFCL